MSKEILNVGLEHRERIIEILADAFESDPVITWVSKDSNYPKDVFEVVLPAFLPHGHVYLTREENGAALWLPPGIEFTFSVGLHILWDAYKSYGACTVIRILKVLRILKKHHYKIPHYYLFAIGVTRDAQGKGFGSALIEKVTAICDKEQMPAYLENTNENNLEFYMRHGFETIDEIKIASGIFLWLMLRRPVNSNAAEQKYSVRRS